MNKNVAIIGAGWAGLAAAVRFTDAGYKVQVFEAAPLLGGRARYADWQQVDETVRIDNGQHILIGAYQETLRILKHVGIDLKEKLQRIPLHIEIPGNHNNRFCLHLPKFPAPLHLVTGLFSAHGLSWKEKKTALIMIHKLKINEWRLLADYSVTELLDLHQQSTHLNQKLWHPLCLAAMNTPPEFASAQTFVNVLRDSLAGSRNYSDFLLPTTDLTTLFPEAAANYIIQRGGEVLSSHAITQLGIAHQGYLVQNKRKSWFADKVILALPPYRVAELMSELATEVPGLVPLVHQVTQFKYQSITTCYLQYARTINLALPLYGLHTQPDKHYYGQWIFNREILCQQLGLLAVVISADGAHLTLDHEVLAKKLDAQLREHFPNLPLLIDSKIICEKRATYACVPGLSKPQYQTGLPGLYLAGDWLDPEYPGTLEAAIRSASRLPV